MNALILIDIQNDFLPGGSLAVKDGDKIIPVINRLLSIPFDLVIASQDWHPCNHGSFAVNHPGKSPEEHILLCDLEQILWPVHCVQNTGGAEFHFSVKTEKFDKVFQKGTDKEIDSYSTFFDNNRQKSTGLDEFLKKNHVEEVYIAGLATDFCVKYSVLDALELGFNVFVIVDACRGVNIHPDDSAKALTEMKSAGAALITTEEAAKKLKREKTRGGGIRTRDLFVPNEAR